MTEITCKAMVQWENGGDLKEETIQVAPPKAGQVRMKVLGSGVCHTDWSEPRNYPSDVTPEGSDKKGFPCILGHEGGCIVESVGEGVTSVAKGDYVIPLYIPECRNCEVCNCGRPGVNGCGASEETQGSGLLPDGTTPFSTTKDGKKIQILMFMGCSTFAEYTVMPEFAVAKISKKAPLEQVCLLGCGVTTGYGAVHNTMRVEAGATAAVFGLGGVGLSVVMGLKEAGAKRIIGVDTNPAKEAVARSFGLTHFINPKELPEGDTPEGTVWQTNGGGVDYTFECIGNPKVMTAAVECLAFGWGKACIIGVAPPGQEVSVKPFQLVCGKTWTGSAFGGCKGRSQLPGYVDNFMEGRAPFVDRFVTKTMPHTEVNEAFHLMHEGKTLRSVITFPHSGDEEVAAHRAEHAKAAIIFMHGLDDVPASWQETAEYLAKKVGPACKAVCPPAPVRAITKNKGEIMTGWCDVLADWPLTPSSKDDMQGLKASVANIHKIIDDLIEKDGIPSERIIVAGFSQGAATATLSTFGYGKKLAGCLNLSGWLPDRENFKPNAANKATPIFWGHGQKDEVLPLMNQKVGVEALGSAGVKNVTSKDYDFGHDTSEAEFDDVQEFIKKALA